MRIPTFKNRENLLASGAVDGLGEAAQLNAGHVDFP
jgi:hypothetical protein